VKIKDTNCSRQQYKNETIVNCKTKKYTVKTLKTVRRFNKMHVHEDWSGLETRRTTQINEGFLSKDEEYLWSYCNWEYGAIEKWKLSCHLR
jgi:hypothetical protein